MSIVAIHQLAAEADRLPPHSREAEQALLGCILWDPKTCIAEVESAFGGVDDLFYDLRHQAIYNGMLKLSEAMAPVEIITLQQVLKDQKSLENVGGVAYLSSLMDAVPSAANLPHYLDVLRQKHLLRRTIRTCSGIVARAYDATNADEVVDEAEREALSIRISAETRTNDIKSVNAELIQRYTDAKDRRAPQGLMTGFWFLDRKAGGMMPQEVIVIGGTPSAGKTSLALNIAWQCATAGTTVSISSLETSAQKLVHRLNCIAGQVDGGPFLRGDPTEEQIRKMTVGLGRVTEQHKRLILHDHGMTAAQWAAICRKDYQKGARLFVLDYLQLLQTKGKDTFEQVTNASKAIKATAKELNCPVICISSLSRQEKGKPRRPQMSDLRQSGQIEFDADKIMLLYSEDTQADLRGVECNIVKNKDGEQGKVDFTLVAGEFRFEETPPVSSDDIPHTHRK